MNITSAKPSKPYTYYMYLMDDPSLKSLSLEDNVYFIVRDIFANAFNTDMCYEANEFNALLTNNTYISDRASNFQYANVLYQPKYVNKLSTWLNHITITDFNIITKEELFECEYDTHMELDVWWEHFTKLRDEITERCYAINELENELN